MLYTLLRPFINFATRQFFREILVRGADPVEEGPLIIVSNHPSVMLDGMLSLATYQRPLWMLAKASIFGSTARNWLLSGLQFIPVHRRQDSPDKMNENETAFSAVCEKLKDGEAVLIFPEGQSHALRKVFPVKTGTARIAFQAEVESNFSLGLKIQPVGLTYSDFQRFRSSVTVRRMEPIVVADYAEEYREDPVRAVKSLSSRIESQLKDALVVIADEQYESIVSKVAKLYRSAGYGEDDNARLSAVVEEVERLSPKHPELVEQYEKRLTLYLQLAESFRLDGSEGMGNSESPLFIVLLCPLVLLGIFVSYPAYRLTTLLGSSMAKGRKSQVASWGVATAFFIFPAWYVLLAAIIGSFTGSILAGTFWFGLFVAAGYSVAWYLHPVMLFLFSTFWPAKRSPVDLIRVMRNDLIQELETYRSK